MSDSGKPRQMPKGGRKGGTQFPQVALEKAATYAKKLVSKTHTSAQPASVILKGVFDSKGPDGTVRASALKQYGLMSGNADAYQASDLAKKLVAAPPEEIKQHLREAFLNAKVFKTLYDTFVSDDVTRAKIRQQASSLKIHPESVDKVAQLFIDGATYAGLATLDADNVTILPPDVSDGAAQPLSTNNDESGEKPDLLDDSGKEEVGRDEGSVDNSESTAPKGSTRAVSSVTFNVDSTMDSDKLEKQLKLLRKYGLI